MGRILEFLTAPAKPAGEASRSNRRRESDARIEFAWLEGASWRIIRARLRDISRGGASLFSAQPPPLARLARVRFVRGEGSPWVECKVLEVTSEKTRRHKVRVQFESPCPSFVLRLAVLEVTEEEADSETPATHYEWAAVNPKDFL